LTQGLLSSSDRQMLNFPESDYASDFDAILSQPSFRPYAKRQVPYRGDPSQFYNALAMLMVPAQLGIAA
jgi:hypothetical protein